MPFMRMDVVANEHNPLACEPAKQDRDCSQTGTEEGVPPLKYDQTRPLPPDGCEGLHPGKRVHGINGPMVFHCEAPLALVVLGPAWEEQARIQSAEADQGGAICLVQGMVEHGGVMGDASSKRMGGSHKRDAAGPRLPVRIIGW